MRCLNLGCGSRFHLNWENVDFHQTAPNVRAHDLRKGIPYADASFDVVYHSHLLEHFSRESAPIFLRECHRVLKPGGVIRVVVPDLESIVRLYLEALEKASHGVPGWAKNYDWMLLEMYDQAVREHSGGSCNEYYRQEPISNWDFVYSRVGAEAEAALAYVRALSKESHGQNATWGSKLRFFLTHSRAVVQNRILRLLLSQDDYEAFQVGLFRREGEVHRWMYDAYSLARLLREVGFSDPMRREASVSLIQNWPDYRLDVGADGKTHKPDSLFMEASKP
jgi:SAM-dependent methyltransferase